MAAPCLRMVAIDFVNGDEDEAQEPRAQTAQEASGASTVAGRHQQAMTVNDLCATIYVLEGAGRACGCVLISSVSVNQSVPVQCVGCAVVCLAVVFD